MAILAGVKWYLVVVVFFFFWLRWVFIAAHGPSSCGKQGILFIAVRRLLIAVASLVAEHGL